METFSALMALCVGNFSEYLLKIIPHRIFISLNCIRYNRSGYLEMNYCFVYVWYTFFHIIDLRCNKLSPFAAWWRHQMETFSALLAICAGNSPASGEFPAQRPVTRSFDVFFDVRVWVNTCEAGHLRRYRIHYDVIVLGHGDVSCEI